MVTLDTNINPNKKEDSHLTEALKKCHCLQSLHSHQQVFLLDSLLSTVDLKKTCLHLFLTMFTEQLCGLKEASNITEYLSTSYFLGSKILKRFYIWIRRPSHMKIKLGTIHENCKKLFLIYFLITTSQSLSIKLRYQYIKTTT